MKIFSKLLLILFFACSYISKGQGLYIPQASPKAAVEQTIGVCNVRIEYSRPSARNRQVFGGLVPYNKVWRAGANTATVLSLEKPATIGGENIAAGKYALMMIPTSDKWTIILNSEWNQWGAYNYDASKDVTRFEIEMNENEFTEMCTYAFDEITKDSGLLVFKWSTTRIEIPIITETKRHTLIEIEESTNAIKQNWYTFSAAAQYHFYELKQANEALKYIDMAIALDAPNPSPWMLKSQILASLGKYAEAIKLAETAIEVCNKTNHAFEVKENEEKIKEWKKKI